MGAGLRGSVLALIVGPLVVMVPALFTKSVHQLFNVWAVMMLFGGWLPFVMGLMHGVTFATVARARPAIVSTRRSSALTGAILGLLLACFLVLAVILSKAHGIEERRKDNESTHGVSFQSLGWNWYKSQILDPTAYHMILFPSAICGGLFGFLWLSWTPKNREKAI